MIIDYNKIFDWTKKYRIAFKIILFLFVLGCLFRGIYISVLLFASFILISILISFCKIINKN
jgi:hypothetical protein